MMARLESLAGGQSANPGFPLALRDEFLARAHIVRVKRGQLLIAAGSDAKEVYLVVAGKVQASLIAPSGRETVLRDIGENLVFGELAALDGGERTTNVVALMDSSIARLSGADFNALLYAVPEAALWMSQNLAAQVRRLTERIYELSTMAVGSRVHCELLRLCIEHGIVSDQSKIEPAPTHAEFAARIGTNREAVTREFGLLADDGIIYQAGRKLTVLSIDKLGLLVRRMSGVE
jgi:CRP/FNR family transcriptional regulator, cyclic AMP receptor protein